MNFLFDNNISHKLANMLRALDEDVTPLRELFPQNITDEELLAAISPPTVFVTADLRQQTRVHEAKAMKASGCTVLFFSRFWGKRMNLWQQAIWLLRRWEVIRNYCEGVAVGTVSEVQQNGRSTPINL